MKVTRVFMVALLIAICGLMVTFIPISAIIGMAQTLTIAIRNWDYDTLDPHISDFTQVTWMVNCYTDTLVRQAPDGSFYPGLAKSWEVSEDGKVWTFRLREGVIFHDGTPWNAAAMLANITRILAPETRSKRFATAFKDLEKASALDEMTVELRFSKPKPTFLQIISDPLFGWLSPTAFLNPANQETHKKLVGTGPWILAEEVYQQKVVFVRNPAYQWGSEYAVHQGPPYIETLVWRFIPEAETRLVALQRGEVDFIDEVPVEYVAALKADPRFDVIIQPRSGMGQQHHLNVTKPPLDDIRVRKAIIYATDREAIVNALFQGVYLPLYGPLMHASPYYNPAVETMYRYDPEKAIQLLEEAGWTIVGSDGFRYNKEGKRLEIDFVAFPGFLAEAPAEMVQAMLAQVGIKMNITVTTGAEMMASCAMCPSPWHSCVVGSSGIDIVSRMYWFGHSSQICTGRNFPHFASAEMDAVIETAMTTLDEKEREAAVKRFQIIWMENALSNPLFSIASVYAYNTRISGITVHLTGTPVFYDARVVK
ncbi:MAG: ABC transporter substrate-binding protein [Candidatus Methanomethylicaceae archaeon]